MRNYMKKPSVLRLHGKAMAMMLAMTILLGGVVSGTIAWLITESPTLVNTFTYGDISIKLEETDTGDQDDDPYTNEYVMNPGKPIAKDPKVTVMAGSEATWLFVKIEESRNFGAFMSYELSEGWLPLTGAQGVYYRHAAKTDLDMEFQVLKNDQVMVRHEVTREMLAALTPMTQPTLKITAYAVQYDAEIEAISTPEKAWELVAGENAPALKAESAQ